MRRRSAQTAVAISSSASGFSTDERSPGSSPSAFAPHRAPDDLRAARLRQRADEHDPLGRERLAQLARRPQPRSRSRVRRRPCPGSSTQKIHATSPFTSCGTPTAAASRDRGVRDCRRLELRRPDALAGDVERVVGASVQEPVAVLVDRRPVAVRPHAGEAAPVRRRGNARASPQRPRVIPGNGSLADELADLAAHSERPSGRTTSMSCRAPGTPSADCLDRLGRTRREEARADLRAARLLLTIGTRPPPTLSKSQRYGSGFHGSPVVQIARSEERSASGSPLGISARTSVGETPSIVTRSCSTVPPEPVGRPVRRAFCEDDRRAERAGRRPRSTAP